MDWAIPRRQGSFGSIHRESGRIPSQWVGAINRYGWAESIGMGGRLPSESPGGLDRNTHILLALSQRENITQIAGIRQWNQLGRRVRAEEKGIMILAPMTVRKRPSEELEEEPESEAEVVTLFKPVYVFDVSQTEGAPLPSLIHASGDATALYPAVQQAIRDANISLELAKHVPGSASASGASYGGRIVVRDDLDCAEGFRTMVHEFAHEKLHWRGIKEEKTVREIEADATAFVVCQHFALQCNTSDYLLLYDATPKVLLERFETIRVTAGEIIDAITEQLSEHGHRTPAAAAQ